MRSTGPGTPASPPGLRQSPGRKVVLPMRKRSTILLTLLAVLAGGAVAVSQPAPDPAHAHLVSGFDFSQPDVVASGLAVPWEMDLPPTPPPAGACTASYQVVNQWPGGFQGEVTVTNTGTGAASGWSVTWRFTSGQVINQLWYGQYTQTDHRVTVSNLSWNGNLAQGASTRFGFLASWSGINNPPELLSCTRT